ncbi:MAG: CTP synthase [Firmicutes bacterium]|nr:CTP synthase [Bacillota bacterium]
MATKYIFITGGVASGLGKGIIAASLGRLIKARGFSVALLKLDPYFNKDSSFISPNQHGEVFVTGDGIETDWVIGHYERILGEDMGDKNAVTSGRVYAEVMKKERAGEYAETVQIVPHITNEIKHNIYGLGGAKTDVVLAEIGGTVGDIECTPFLEAIRQVRSDTGRKNTAYIHMTFVPFIEMSGEQKTKPTQRSVKELQDVGIQPDAIVCRTDYPLDTGSKQKLSLFCNVPLDAIVESLSSDEVHDVPLNLESEGLANVLLKKLQLPDKQPDLSFLQSFSQKAAAVKSAERKLKIGVIGKYAQKHNAYISLSEAIFYSALGNSADAEIVWISGSSITAQTAAKHLKGLDGVVVASGAAECGVAGIRAACEYARRSMLPCLMIGLGAQAAVIADTDASGAVIETSFTARRGVQKLGLHKSSLQASTHLSKIYGGAATLTERHRHKYEINADAAEKLFQNGYTVSAVSADNAPVAFELPKHKFFIGVAFRPEFTARPDKPHPLFDAFIGACLKK